MGGSRRSLALVVLLAAACSPAGATRPSALQLSEVLSGDARGFEQALGPARLEFPRDHGPHPAFRNEWWYLTGNLDAAGRRVGFELTFFRTALTPREPTSGSAWATRQVYMAHFAVTDPDGIGFWAQERFSRAALSLAGARSRPFRVWLEDWYLQQTGPSPATADGRLRLAVAAQGDRAGIRLVLSAAKGAALHGERGYSRKGARPGNASYYYSLPRMDVSGQVWLGSSWLQARGEAWLDREWSSSALEAEQTGWDWFGLQLQDGTELMLYRLRRIDDAPDRFSSGTYVRPDGSTRALSVDEFRLRPTHWWHSPATGVRYPVAWEIEVPPLQLHLRAIPIVQAQELDLRFRYWEGAVDVEGRRGDTPVTGRGYVELTGYAPCTDC